MKKSLLFFFTVLMSFAVFGQSSPGFYFGQVPTPAQWNSYFSGKVDYVSGGLPISAGGTGATTAAGARINLSPYGEDLVTMPTSRLVGAPTNPLTLATQLDHLWSAGVTDGAGITDNGNGTVNVASSNTLLRATAAITSITRSSQTATVTTTGNHGYSTGDVVHIRGANQTEYNGIFYITVTGLTTFTYTVSGSPATPATGTTIIAVNEASPLNLVTVPAATNLALTDHVVNYIIADWNAGTPIYSVTTDVMAFYGHARVSVWQIAREGNTLWHADQRGTNVDVTNKIDYMEHDTEGFNHVIGGTLLSATGTRNIAVTAGAFWLGTNRYSTPAFDTSGTDRFTTAYTSDGGSTWTYTTAQAAISNTQYNNTATGLASIAVGQYGVFWIYMMQNNPPTLMVLYGQSSYTKSDAFGSQEPTVKPAILGNAALLGRIIILQGASSFIDITGSYIKIFPNTKPDLNSLSDVNIGTPSVGDMLTYNGVLWVNAAGISTSGGPGVTFYNATPNIIATGTNNTLAVNTLSKVPVTTAEQTTATSLATNTVPVAAWLYGTALGRTSINAGVWQFDSFAGVNSVAGGRVTTITRNVMQVIIGSGTVATTSSGTSRTATITAGTPFVSGDASATNTAASYLQTPQGLYQITGFTNDHTVTIAVPSTYVNETGVAYNNWRLLFSATSPTITSISPTYSSNSFSSTQAAFTVNATDYLGVITFGTSNNTTTLTTAYNGATHNSDIISPLSVLHNELSGLQGGSSNQYYHLTSDEYAGTGVGTGNIARLSGATFVGPNLGTPASGTLTNTAGLPVAGITMNTARLIGRTTTSAGTAEEITVGTGLTLATGTLTGNVGTVTSTSVASANGFAGTVATDTSTPAITISTSVSGILKGNGTAVSAATAGSDYVAPGAATTFTAAQTFTNDDIKLLGSSTGATTFHSANAGASNYTLTTPAITATVATLEGPSQAMTGGVHVTPTAIGTVSSGTTTIDCGTSPLQYLVNGGAFTLAAPANDSSCLIYVLNNGTAGAISFSGFTVGSNTGDALTTTDTQKFTISIWRINSVAGYRTAAMQ